MYLKVKINEESILLLCLLFIPNFNPILNEESLLSLVAFHQFIGSLGFIKLN